MNVILFFDLQAEAEMREKIALIAKIRAIERVPRIRFKVRWIIVVYSEPNMKSREIFQGYLFFPILLIDK